LECWNLDQPAWSGQAIRWKDIATCARWPSEGAKEDTVESDRGRHAPSPDPGSNRTSRRPGSVRGVDASAVATELLDGVGTRLAHSRTVAHQARRAATILDGPWSAALLDAAWLHDIGYAPALAITGFHPLDGARWLRSNGWPAEVCNLVAWHTRAVTEAALRDLETPLVAEFPAPPALAQAALAWADLTSSPTGGCCSATDRLVEIQRRYSPDSVVHRSITANLPRLLEDAALIEAKILQQVPV